MKLQKYNRQTIRAVCEKAGTDFSFIVSGMLEIVQVPFDIDAENQTARWQTIYRIGVTGRSAIYNADNEFSTIIFTDNQIHDVQENDLGVVVKLSL